MGRSRIQQPRALKSMLEGFQAGLSWITILKKSENFRKAFAEFDPDILCMWGEVDVNHLLQNPGIIRHRGKIEATLSNAKAWQSIENDIGFGNFLWPMWMENRSSTLGKTFHRCPPKHLCQDRFPRI